MNNKVVGLLGVTASKGKNRYSNNKFSKTKNPPGHGGTQSLEFPHLAFNAGFGTLQLQVAVASSGRSLRHS